MHRLLIGAMALGTALGVMTAIVGVSTVPAGSARPALTGSGTFSCGTIGGKVTFTPPLKTGGLLAETEKFNVHTKDCSGNGNPLPKAVKLKGTLAFSTNSCANVLLATQQPVLNLTYAASPAVIASVFNPAGSFNPNAGPATFSGSVTGSYATAFATLTFNYAPSGAPLSNDCANGGVAQLVVVAAGSSMVGF